MPSDNPSKGKFEENICSYRYSFKCPPSSILLLNPKFQKIAFITSLFLYCDSVVLCIDCVSLTVSEVVVKCNNNLYVRGDEADPAPHSAGGSGRTARNA